MCRHSLLKFKGNALTKANARGGSITKDIQFKPLIKEFTKKDFNHKLNVNRLF